jgi:hypothetical protein
MSESSVLSSFHSRTMPLSTSWLYEDRRIMLESRAWRKAGGGRSDIRPCSASAGRGGSMGAMCGLGIVPCDVKNDEDEDDDDDAKSSTAGTSVDFFFPKMLVRFTLTEVAFASCERARTWPCDEVIGSSSSPECVIRCPMGANDVLTACGGGAAAECVLNWEGNTSCEFPTVKEALRKLLLLLLLEPGPLTLVRRRGDISPLEVIIDGTGDDRSPLSTVCDPEVYMTKRER